MIDGFYAAIEGKAHGTARASWTAMPEPVPHRSPPGFRFSRLDAVVLLLSAIVAAVAWRLPTNPGLIVITVVGHFFLFCNVVRLRRSFELMWAACYVVLVAFCTIALRSMNWLVPLAAVTPVTVALIALEVRSDRYHGIGWRRVGRGNAT